MPRRATFFTAGSLLLTAAFSASPAFADLIIDPTTGISLIFSDPNDSVRTRSLGFTGQFFGLSHTTVDISTNGNLNFSSNASFADGLFPRSTARIAPLWDDLTLNDSGSVTTPGTIVETTNPGVYYSITWTNIFRLNSFNPNKTDTFQAVWFGAATTIGTFAFQKDDIAFSYQMVNADFDPGGGTVGMATVGVNKGSNGVAAILPGSTNGVITNAQKNLLPTTNHQFILFRPDGADGYVASMQATAANGATVTGRVALEGVTDLTKTSSFAPLGKFHVSLRTPMTTTEQYGYDVTLTGAAGSAFGTYTLPNVPAGTYDAAIKGAKNLRVAVPGVVISGATGTISDVLLPAGDTNNDNIIDPTDFNTFVSAYNSSATIAGSGYDPTADYNYDGIVDPTDFGLFVSNYATTGAN